MEGEPEVMHSLGIGGIYKEAFKILRTYTRLLMSLAFTLVLPLGIVIFSHYLISDRLEEKIFRNENLVSQEEGTPAAADTEKVLDKEVVGLGILTLLYVIFVLAFSLLSTSAIVYSVASIYTGKGLSYFKVISVVPKVWKRLVITFLWAQLVILCYNISFAILFFLFLLLQKTIGVTMLPILIPLAVAFYMILVYLNLLWHLASVISVLEDSTGLHALRKSYHLMQGKNLIGFCLFLIYIACTVTILSFFQIGVVSPTHHLDGVAGRVILGFSLLVLWTGVTLVGILAQTVLYFVCKAYHNESIDRYTLSDHLDGYLEVYTPLKGPISLAALDAELEEV
jgi:hypothetical protein